MIGRAIGSKRQLAAVLAVISCVVAAGATVKSQAAESASSSQISRVATFAEQATSGHNTYMEQCSACHQEDLSGTDMIPALAGSAFMARWQGKTAKDLFDRMRTTMPSTDPGSLTPAQYLAITAYILQVNNITPPQDLTTDNVAGVTIKE